MSQQNESSSVDSSLYAYKLYKYRSFDEANRYYTSRIVLHSLIYYASPGQLNDPFDCKFCVNMEGASLKEIGSPNTEDAKTYSEEWFWSDAKKDLAILSFSECNDNSLMWSHYSNSHAGICLEMTFETHEPLHKINYSKSRPEFYFEDIDEQTRDEERFGKAVISLLTTKDTNWTYEKEWRCIEFGGSGEKPMPDGMLTGIIFGCRTSQADKQMVREWVDFSGQKIRYYQAHQVDGKFALEIEEIQ